MEEHKTQPAMLVIFGITGDLAKRKLLPALYHLMRDNLLHPDTQIIGVTRRTLHKTEVLGPLDKYVASHSRPSPRALKQFKQAFHLVSADIASEDGYTTLRKYLDNVEFRQKQPMQRLYYLSIPPSIFDEVVTFMGKAGMHKPYNGGPKPAVLIEKPFGYDLESAKELIKSAKQYFAESQLYRIDHYLAKEMAQNILDFRLYNPIFEAVWNRQHIQKVVITAYEKIGIEGRAQFYEQTGALRDLIQSHLLQLMSLIAMEPPPSLESSVVHARRYELLNAVRKTQPHEANKFSVRGQYRGYTREVKHKRSTIETFAATVLFVENSRWKNVPFILQTGKALKEKRTDIQIHFSTNLMTFQLQPEELISLMLHHKKPGHGHQSDRSIMDFSYRRSYPSITSPEAYERVLLDAIRQDQMLFATSDEVLASWKIIMPILDEWSKSSTGLEIYEKGSEGPDTKKLEIVL